MSKGSTLRGFFVGTVLGAAAGLLLAPRSGEDTRSLFKSESQKIKDSTLEAIQESKENALESIAKAYDQVEELRVETNQRLNQLREITETSLGKQKKILQKAVSETKGSISGN